MGIGLLLLGMAGGAPFLPKLAQIAKGDLAFAVGLMVLLMVITVDYVPIVLPMLLPGVPVNPAQIARSLVLLMLLTLGGALAVKANRPNIAAKIKPIFDKASDLSLIALMGLQTLLNVRSVVAAFRWGAFSPGSCFWAWASPLAGSLAAQRGTHDPPWVSGRRSGTSPPPSSSPARASRIRTWWRWSAPDSHAVVPRARAARAGDDSNATRLRGRARSNR